MPRSGTGWPARGLLWEGRCGGEPFPSLVFSWHLFRRKDARGKDGAGACMGCRKFPLCPVGR